MESGGLHGLTGLTACSSYDDDDQRVFTEVSTAKHACCQHSGGGASHPDKHFWLVSCPCLDKNVLTGHTSSPAAVPVNVNLDCLPCALFGMQRFDSIATVVN